MQRPDRHFHLIEDSSEPIKMVSFCMKHIQGKATRPTMLGSPYLTTTLSGNDENNNLKAAIGVVAFKVGKVRKGE
jgi:hypothetical protein